MQSGTERPDVIGFGSGKFTDGHIITMYEIDKFITGSAYASPREIMAVKRYIMKIR